MLNRYGKLLVSTMVPVLGLFITLGAATAENIAVGNYGELGERHAVRRCARQGLLPAGGRERHRHHRLAGRRHVACAT